jgi:hypothetical protein
MAIDSQQKRMAVVGVGRPWMRSTFPGTINEAWRVSVGNAYSGNALTPGVGRIMSSLASYGGLAGPGGIAGQGGGLAA